MTRTYKDWFWPQLVVILGCCWHAAAADPAVIRGPYLGWLTSTSIVVRWRTDQATDSRVRFGPDAGNLTQNADQSAVTNEHIVTITGLSAATQYYYSVGTTAGALAESSNYLFTTAPPPGTGRSTRIFFLTDFGLSDLTEGAVRDTFLAQVASDQRWPDLWLTGGDNDQEWGSDATYQSGVFNYYSNVLCRTPFFPTGGNHDATSDSALWSSFSMPTQGEAGGVASGTQKYYSFNYGELHCICLNGSGAGGTSTASNSPMFTWLRQDLAANTQRWTIAYWHAPAYSKVFYDSDTDPLCTRLRENALPILEAAGVDLVLTGHAHALQRTYLIQQHYGKASTFSPTNQVDAGNGRTDGTGAYLKTGNAGTVYCVAPTGCGQIRSGSAHPACAATLMNTAGFLLVDVNSNRLDFRCLTSTGATADYFTILKGNSQKTPPAAPAEFTGLLANSSGVLTWANNATNEAAYSLEYSVNSGPYTELARLGANLTNFTHSVSNNAGAYTYRLRAWNNAGYSSYSRVASLLPVAERPQLAEAPTHQAGTLLFRYRGTAGAPYRLQTKGSLNDTVWQDVLTTNMPAGGLLHLEQSTSNAPQRFFRLVSP